MVSKLDLKTNWVGEKENRRGMLILMQIFSFATIAKTLQFQIKRCPLLLPRLKSLLTTFQKDWTTLDQQESAKCNEKPRKPWHHETSENSTKKLKNSQNSFFRGRLILWFVLFFETHSVSQLFSFFSLKVFSRSLWQGSARRWVHARAKL